LAKIKEQREQEENLIVEKRNSGTKIQNGVRFTGATLGIMDSMRNEFAKKPAELQGVFTAQIEDLKREQGRGTP
jgi:hypothetical protein